MVEYETFNFGVAGSSPAGPTRKNFMPKLKIEEVARITYEACRAIRIAQGKNDRLHWEDVSEFYRNLHIEGVKWALNHPTTDPIDAHDKWMSFMIEAEKQNDENVKHLMVPFQELDLYEQAKDVLFMQIVNGLRDYTDVNS